MFLGLETINDQQQSIKTFYNFKLLFHLVLLFIQAYRHDTNVYHTHKNDCPFEFSCRGISNFLMVCSSTSQFSRGIQFYHYHNNYMCECSKYLILTQQGKQVFIKLLCISNSFYTMPVLANCHPNVTKQKQSKIIKPCLASFSSKMVVR